MSNNNENKSSDLGVQVLKFGLGIAAGIFTLVAAKKILEHLDKPKDLLDAVEKKTPKVSFLILGGRKVGKTALIAWIKSISDNQTWFDLEKGYQPTLPNGADVPEMYIELGSNQYNIVIPVDLSGDFGGPNKKFNKWEEVYQDDKIQLNGLIFMLDHKSETSIEMHVDAWNGLIELFKENKGNAFNRSIKALYIVVNKSDLWADDITSSDIVEKYYFDQFEITKRVAARLNWKLKISDISLLKEKNVIDMMSSFVSDLQTA